MPFKSKAQMRKFGEMVKQGKMTKEEFEKWAKDTPDTKNLPEKIGPTGVDRIRHAQKSKVIK